MLIAARTSRCLTGLLCGISMPLVMGGCPADPPPTNNVPQTTPTILLSTTRNNLNQVTFNPTSAGKVITASVSAEVSGSRVRVQVRDNLNAVVATDQAPVTNTTTVSFTSITTGTHTMTMTQIGNPTATYTILVQEAP